MTSASNCLLTLTTNKEQRLIPKELSEIELAPTLSFMQDLVYVVLRPHPNRPPPSQGTLWSKQPGPLDLAFISHLSEDLPNKRPQPRGTSPTLISRLWSYRWTAHGHLIYNMSSVFWFGLLFFIPSEWRWETCHQSPDSSKGTQEDLLMYNGVSHLCGNLEGSIYN